MSKIVVKHTLQNPKTTDKIMSLDAWGRAFREKLRY